MTGPYFEFPLDWPPDVPRTRDGAREHAKFSRRPSGHGHSRDRRVTLANARKRISDEIRAFTRCGHPWRIDPDEVVISTDLLVRLLSGRSPVRVRPGAPTKSARYATFTAPLRRYAERNVSRHLPTRDQQRTDAATLKFRSRARPSHAPSGARSGGLS